MKNEEIVGHNCEVTWKNGFILHGIIKDADEDGIILQTKQKISWISLSKIEKIIVED